MSRPPPLILASSSPTRAKLFSACALHFSAVAANLDEGGIIASLEQEGTTPEDIARYLAAMKAKQVDTFSPSPTPSPSSFSSRSLVIGADQVLTCEGKILKKADTLSSLRETLLFLRAKEHRFYSAAAVVREGSVLWSHCASACVHLRDFDEPFLDAYLTRFGVECLSSVGGYRIEEEGALMLARVEGDPYVVQGLPLLELLAFLRELPNSDSFFLL